MWGWLAWTWAERAEARRRAAVPIAADQMPQPVRLTFGAAEELGPDLADRFALLLGGRRAIGRDDYLFVDVVQFALRRAGEVHAAQQAALDDARGAETGR